MKTLRFALSLVGPLLLTAGYIWSQVAYFRGEYAQYAERIDQPPIVMASLLLFLVAVLLAFVPSEAEGADHR